jgi:hypothetical protein
MMFIEYDPCINMLNFQLILKGRSHVPHYSCTIMADYNICMCEM